MRRARADGRRFRLRLAVFLVLFVVLFPAFAVLPGVLPGVGAGPAFLLALCAFVGEEWVGGGVAADDCAAAGVTSNRAARKPATIRAGAGRGLEKMAALMV
jgi:hypothetical protein